LRIALMATALALTSCQSPAEPGAAPSAAVSNAALILDVREPSEFDAGHLQAAENIPVGQVEARADEIARKLDGDKSKPITVYCKSGSRAGRAKAALEKAGFSNVTNAGGYDKLKSSQ
jgi:phage shock protein E